jgi:hypothetical protein
MKHMLVLSLFALAVLAGTNQKAQAWKKWNFNVGLNVNSEAADNNFMWGLYRNGPVPGSQGHGYASTMTHTETASHLGHGYDGGGSHYMPGNYHSGIESHGSAPIYATNPSHGGAMPYADAAPAFPMPRASTPAPTLPAPAQSVPLQSSPMVTPASYYWPAPSYYWAGY